jgi:membrane protein DedA with SNARE-associated domain
MTIVSIISGFSIVNLGLLFLFVFLSSIGPPTGIVAMVSSGAISNNFGTVIVLMIIAAVAAIAGDIIAYEFARRFSFLREKLQKYRFYAKGEAKARILLKKYEFFSVFITRFFLTGLCAPISYISGFEKLSRKKYLLAVVSGEILNAIIYTLLGYAFKLAWNNLVEVLENFIAAITILAIVAILFAIIVPYIRRKRSHSAQKI